MDNLVDNDYRTKLRSDLERIITEIVGKEGSSVDDEEIYLGMGWDITFTRKKVTWKNQRETDNNLIKYDKEIIMKNSMGWDGLESNFYEHKR